MDQDELVERLTRSQRPLYAYIRSLLGPVANIDDVLQETNLKLWQNIDSYDLSKPFLPWAYAFAFNIVRTHRAAQARSRLVFDDALLRLVHKDYLRRSELQSIASESLRECLDQLPESQKDLIDKRYSLGYSVKAMAQHFGQEVGLVANRLYRIRLALAKCVSRKSMPGDM